MFDTLILSDSCRLVKRKMPFSATAELCLMLPRPSGGSSDPEGRGMLTEQIAAIGQAAWASLDALARSVWVDHAAGRLADAEAQQLAEAIEARRRALKQPIPGQSPLRVCGAGRRRTGARGQRRGPNQKIGGAPVF